MSEVMGETNSKEEEIKQEEPKRRGKSLSQEELEEYHLDTSKIEKNLQKIDSTTIKKKLIVLIQSGSHAPVHLMHIAMFTRAKEHLERKRNEIVIGGFICPSSDGYVKCKLKENWIPLWQRNDMAQLATKESDWISVCEWGRADGPTIAYLITEILYSKFPNYEFECLEMHGADTVLKYGPMCCEIRLVVHMRPGYSEKLRELIKENSKDGTDGELIIVDGELEDISSTAVRSAVLSNDRQKLITMLHPNVADFMLNIVRPELSKCQNEQKDHI